MMRALALWHSEASPYQYLFGRDLLVCPVVEPGLSTWPVYVPDGGWYDLWTGERFEGGQIVNMPTALDRMPVLVRAGAQIPVRSNSSRLLGESVSLASEATTMLTFDQY